MEGTQTTAKVEVLVGLHLSKEEIKFVEISYKMKFLLFSNLPSVSMNRSSEESRLKLVEVSDKMEVHIFLKFCLISKE